MNYLNIIFITSLVSVQFVGFAQEKKDINVLEQKIENQIRQQVVGLSSAISSEKTKDGWFICCVKIAGGEIETRVKSLPNEKASAIEYQKAEDMMSQPTVVPFQLGDKSMMTYNNAKTTGWFVVRRKDNVFIISGKQVPFDKVKVQALAVDRILQNE